MEILSSFFSGLASLLEVLAKTGVLAVVVAISGWVFVYKNSRALQKRSETWAIVKNISDLLKDIESSSRGFWLPSDEKFTSQRSYQAEINGGLAELERWMEHLMLRINNKKLLDDTYKDTIVKIFRDATYNMEQASSTSEVQRMRITSTVSKHTKIMKERIDSAYEGEFFKK
ncbi:hypothetical protein UDZ25_05940 [Serratia marcescens]|uniref:hypothetical protein n=1 Tax=Serratia marcescens TaxID=615 RepID=UPI0007453B8B|nr:hypothetical protein [Serratia marcescens]CUZ53996.1 Uncharacterised protein [Serratia marcescens]HEJ6927692.1 hypothetical protein [Serratia marcescens]HEJ7073921.1 hypothetical protein [Serratia marcescens]HEJ7196976.1 hypothetical protein [Serratia marcescens]